MLYADACRTLIDHQPRHRPRLLRWLITERCRTCGEAWPCPPRREARTVIINAGRAGFVR